MSFVKFGLTNDESYDLPRVTLEAMECGSYSEWVIKNEKNLDKLTLGAFAHVAQKVLVEVSRKNIESH